MNSQIKTLFESFLLLLFLLFIILLTPIATYAHPLDESGDIKVYDQVHRLLFTPEKVTLTIDLTFYPTEKIKVWESIDTNKDQKLTNEEKNIWMKKGQEASWVEKDDQKIPFDATSLAFPDYYDFFGEKTGHVSIIFAANRSVSQGKMRYVYQGKDQKLEEITFEAKGDHGLKVENVQKESSDSMTFEIQEGLQEGTAVLGLTTNNRLNSFLNRYVKVKSIPKNLLVFAFAISFFLGALHALTPGHGKAIVASYLVGSRGTIWHAIHLGAIVTITHTASVFLLGLASVVLTAYVVPSTVVRALNTVSGLLVFGFGLYLIIKRVRALHADLEHEHRHSLGVAHDHEHEQGHTHTHDEEISWRNIVPLGISGGIVPCVDALAILIVAISLQKTLFGLLLLVFFSLGLASALIVIGSFAVMAKGQFQKRIAQAPRFEKYVSLISAFVVTLLGLGIILNIGI